MLNDMPLIPLNNGPRRGVKVNSLDEFQGFIKVKVSLPAGIERPLLPVKYEGKTIFPTGQWVGTYFSEELKAAKKLIPPTG